MISANSLELISLEFFIGTPQSVRGLGNILMDDPPYVGYLNEVTQSTDTVNNTDMKVNVLSFSAADSVELSYSFVETITIEDETVEDEESENDGL